MNIKPPTLEAILRVAQIPESKVLAVYPYGSRVYGTHGHSSDHDYIVVYDFDYNDVVNKDSQQYDSYDKSISVHTYHEQTWNRHLDDQKIFAVECHSLMPMEMFSFQCRHDLLRKEISSKASNSWVKCKKKLTVETGEEHIGIKSLFHSFRIPMFGIQVAQQGRIVDFTVANDLWFNEFEPMLHNIPTWDIIKEEYQPRHNALMSEFRKYAEKV